MDKCSSCVRSRVKHNDHWNRYHAVCRQTFVVRLWLKCHETRRTHTLYWNDSVLQCPNTFSTPGDDNNYFPRNSGEARTALKRPLPRIRLRNNINLPKISRLKHPTQIPDVDLYRKMCRLVQDEICCGITAFVYGDNMQLERCCSGCWHRY